MRVVCSTRLAVAALDWAHTYFWAFLYYFLELLGGSRFPRGTNSKIKIVIFFVPWGTQRELVNTPWTHHMLHLFLVEWGTSCWVF